MHMLTKRLVLTSGEPAGIGPDLCLLLAQQAQQQEIITLACPQLLQQRLELMQQHTALYPIKITPVSLQQLRQTAPKANKQCEIKVLPVDLTENVIAGQLNKHNADYVVNMLNVAIDGCSNGLFDAMITAPVQKSVIAETGITFTGHTEYLAQRTNTAQVVMMLATEDMRVALVTTHTPLKDVAQAITPERLTLVSNILYNDLKNDFGIAAPRILVAGLNPHAGENGHLGTEEIDIINPVLKQLREQGMQFIGPLPADTLFTDKYLANADAVLAMYHDQGLPVLKFHGFGKAANITLGLPIIRTSVDHGTALDLAGTGNIDEGSLRCAINIAGNMALARHQKS